MAHSLAITSHIWSKNDSAYTDTYANLGLVLTRAFAWIGMESDEDAQLNFEANDYCAARDARFSVVRIK